MSYPYNAAPPGPIPSPPNDRKQIVIVLAVVAALLLTFLGVGAAYMLTNSGSKVEATTAPDLVLEAAGSSGTDPFSPSVAVSNRPLGDAAALAPQGAVTVRGVEGIDGTTSGLYASDGDAVCDTAALANFLANNPAKARAWASVFGIDTAQIPYYLDTLTPVVLTRDTWVTNHSYSADGAYAFQSVFQAGTAVLVDAYGVPRVRCACGNPLAPPASTPIAGYRPVGHPWDHYGPSQVVYVTYYNEHTTIVNNTTTVVAAPNPAPAPAALTLIDLNTLQPLIRTVGGILNLEGLPPLTEPLPTPAALNAPFTTDDPVLQEANGIQADGAPAPEVQRRAAAVTSVSAAIDSAAPQAESSGESADPASPVSSDPAVPAVSGAPAAPSSSAAPAPSSSAAPTPTVFTGSGDIVSRFTFTADNTSVTCTVPDPTQTTVELICSDGVKRTVSTTSLGQTSITTATDTFGVWTVKLTDITDPALPKPETATITSAVWTLIPTATAAPPTSTATAAPTSKPTTVTSEPTTASSAPAAG
ncbi:DUF6777 domain-containing protein [Nocardia sp. 348MFTsu5.1]|uniref:DUF6777 domain-containing protein n=1 Tax=Nocardia sp. 348MFTsu5.1 TaxID=1172185 RepID=UPI0003A1FB1F|nr:DUF6777 domain-containing protein [Nocardia sp. 348MFTsu5.1]